MPGDTPQFQDQYVALLRGINVGGKNLIRMADLVACFESGGFADVRTYIQSGNVLFRSSEASPTELRDHVEKLLSTTFGYTASVVLRTREQLRAIVDEAPEGFGAQPDIYRSDVIFLMPPLTAGEAMVGIPTREGVDEVHPGPGALYFSRLTERAAKSRLSKLVSMPMYQRVTIRNWNTTTKLLALMDEQSAAR